MLFKQGEKHGLMLMEASFLGEMACVEGGSLDCKGKAKSQAL